VQDIIYAVRNKSNTAYELGCVRAVLLLSVVIILLQYVRTDRPARSAAATAVHCCSDCFVGGGGGGGGGIQNANKSRNLVSVYIVYIYTYRYTRAVLGAIFYDRLRGLR